MKKLILLELNEINIDVVSSYLKRGVHLPGFKKVSDDGFLETKAESKYDLLEPWIQWPSVHIGKTFSEHNIFRLGDCVDSKEKQFFEKVESSGFSVGAISPMNAKNNLENPAYFIPDPWTQTSSDNSYFSKSLTQAIRQAVNDNSKSKIKFKTLFSLILAFIFFIKPTNYFRMSKYAFKALRKPWRKALFLDMVLYEVHKTLFKRKSPNFSTLFLNAGAHIQHHYFFNSPFVDSPKLKNPSWYVKQDEDPFLEMLNVYDEILLDLITLPNTEIIIATGLSQKPYEKLKFYYRLKDHSFFLKKMNIDFEKVIPRMTRDFLISFDTKDKASKAENKLSKILVNNDVKLFEEIDNRGKDIFAVLTYPYEITNETKISSPEGDFLLKDFITFVAIKNGEHQSKGFAYFSGGISKFAPPQESHVSKIHYTILQFFGIHD